MTTITCPNCGKTHKHEVLLYNTIITMTFNHTVKSPIAVEFDCDCGYTLNLKIKIRMEFDEVTLINRSPDLCATCQDTGVCQYCQGLGHDQADPGAYCRDCAGTGLCAECASIPALYEA